jgi:putative iron-dependent peroxidase
MKHAPNLDEQTHDIQAVLGSGFGWLTSSRFWLLTLLDAALAAGWIRQLQESKLVLSVKDVGARKLAGEEPGPIAAIAFSHAGLRRLGVLETGRFPFPTAFKSGMGSALREQLLRDSPRTGWQWSDQEAAPDAPSGPDTVHILLGVWWRGPDAPVLPPFPDGAFQARQVQGCPSFFRGKNLYEPFGFRDGISQPSIYGLKGELDPDGAGLSPAQRRAIRDSRVASGEFVLGYRNEYDELSYCPDAMGWQAAAGPAADRPARFGLNGSYLAVRQIQQDVQAFARFADMPAPGCPAGISVADKMMGRLRDGRPLAMAGQPNPTASGDATRSLGDLAVNMFRYRVEDDDGFVTPRGSHIRRVNPRDTLGHDSDSGITASKLHRLLRRGRPYREVDGAGAAQQGLFFIACNTDLERQFEFVQQRWIMNPRQGPLEHEDDPVVGAAGAKTFSMAGLPCGQSVSFQSFTATLGGGYFFLPGISALHFICARLHEPERAKPPSP